MRPAGPEGSETSSHVVHRDQLQKERKALKKIQKREKVERQQRIKAFVSHHTVAVRFCGKVTPHDEHLYYAKSSFGSLQATHCEGKS